MNWPYRLLVRARTAEINLFIIKKVYWNTTRPREVELMEPMDDLLKKKSLEVNSKSSDVTTDSPTSEIKDNPSTGNPTDSRTDAPEQSSTTSYSDPISRAEPHPNVSLSSYKDTPCDYKPLLAKNVRLPVIADERFSFEFESYLLKEIPTNEMRQGEGDGPPSAPVCSMPK